MSGEFNVRVPPDSTGKRIRALAQLEIPYANRTQDWDIPSVVTGSISGVVGTIVEDHIESPTSGHLIVLLRHGSPQVTTAGEDLVVGGIPVATVDGTSTAFYTQNVSLVGSNNPNNGVFVDQRGSMNVRFTDGVQQLDSFGVSRFTSPHQVSSYTFIYDIPSDDISFYAEGTGSHTHLQLESSIALDVETSAVDSSVMSTDLYHPYQAGFSQAILMTVASGDTGKQGVTRRWGYYDAEDGIYFELQNNQMFVCVRSSTSGVVTETRIPQNEWNGDRLDGQGGLTNLSHVILNPSKVNLFWFDFQWLGGGRVRFGIYREGVRITAHAENFANENITAWMRRPDLPIRMEIFNTAATASPSRLKMICATVTTDGDLVPDRQRKSRKHCFGLSSAKSVPDTQVHLMTFRPTLTYNGHVNRKIIIPELLSFVNLNQPVVIRFLKNCVIANDTWEDFNSGSATQVSTDADLITAGPCLFSLMLAPGESLNHEFPMNFGLQGEALYLEADGNHGVSYTITAQSLTPGQNASLFSAISVIEID